MREIVPSPSCGGRDDQTSVGDHSVAHLTSVNTNCAAKGQTPPQAPPESSYRSLDADCCFSGPKSRSLHPDCGFRTGASESRERVVTAAHAGRARWSRREWRVEGETACPGR